MKPVRVKASQVHAWFRAILFILPALAFYIVFSTIPIFNTIQLSFYEWDGASPTMTFVGFANFQAIFQDDIFWRALYHNLFWILFTIFVPVTIGLILATILSKPFIRFRLTFRVTYFMPQVVSLVAVGVVWNWIYNPVFGILNRFIQAIGLHQVAPNWLGSEKIVLLSLLIAGSWTYYGFCMVIFLAALSGIDSCYNDVAMIEGANPLQKFFYVTVPLLKNTVILLILHSLIGSFKVFDLVYMMTRGGPFYSSEVISTYMFRTAFNFSEVGKGAAISIVLALIIAFCSLSFLHLTERE